MKKQVHLILTGMVCLMVSHSLFGNDTKPLFQKEELLKVIRDISFRYDVHFTYDREIVEDVVVDGYNPDDYHNVDDALAKVLSNTKLKYVMLEMKYVIIYRDDAAGMESLQKMVKVLQTIIDEKKASNSSLSLQYLTKDVDLKNIHLERHRMVLNIRGQVKDAAGQPLIGVNVLVKGSNQGTATDFDGNFELNDVNENATLVFSYIGYQSQEVVLNGRSNINITLFEDSQTLDEVVVVGYGTMKKIELTNAVSSVKSEDFVKGSIIDPAQLIKGKVAGLRIVNTNANPTDISQIVLRGITTLSSGTQPLIVIDGVPGSLNDVAPENIQSIDVLKDGAGAAIYGSRGTNGVIIITTNVVKGNIPSTIELTSYLTTQDITKELRFLNSNEYRELAKEGKPGAIDYGFNSNWINEVLRRPLSQTYNVNLKGGRNNSNYNLNINSKSLEGLMIKSDNKITNIQFQTNHSMFEGKVRINGNLIGYDQKYFAGGDGFSWRGDVYRNALIYNPTDPLKNEYGDWTEHPDVNNYANPLALIDQVSGEINTTNLKPFGSILIYPIDGVSIKALASKNIYNQTGGYSEFYNHINSIINNRQGYASRRTARRVDDLFEFVMNYNYEIRKYKFDFLGGYSFQENISENYWSNNFDFPSDIYTYNNLSDGTALKDGKANLDSYKYSSRLVSYFARMNFNVFDKYLIMMSLRHEGSTKFGKNHKWGSFPGVSVGWNMKNEKFLKNFNFVNNLKLRAGFGLTGTVPSSSYQSLSRLSYGSRYLFEGNWTPVIYPTSNANPDLRWEKKEEFNVGFEIGILDGRVSGELDIYKRKTKDLLWNYSVASPPYLYNSVLANAGVIENNGIELLVNSIAFDNKSFVWRNSLVFSTNNNKLVSLSNEDFKLESNYFYSGSTGEPIKSTTHIVQEGERIGNFFGYKTIGIDDEGFWVIEGKDGKPKSIKDQNPQDKMVIGNGLPKYYLNFNNQFRFGHFDLDISMRGAFKYQILNMTKMFYGLPISLTRGNILKSSYDEVYNKRPVNNMQDLQYVSYFIENGSFWKIDNITLGYNFKFKSSYLKRLRLYLSGSNMFTFTKYSGLDPEVNSLGLNPGSDNRDRYPSTRSITFGISAKF